MIYKQDYNDKNNHRNDDNSKSDKKTNHAMPMPFPMPQKPMNFPIPPKPMPFPMPKPMPRPIFPLPYPQMGYMPNSSQSSQMPYTMSVSSNYQDILLPASSFNTYNNFDEVEEDIDYMKTMYPDVIKKVLVIVEDECDKLEFDGSCMFDQYPDKISVNRIADTIFAKVKHLDSSIEANELEAKSCDPYGHCDDRPNWLRNVVDILLFNEMHHRRRRRHGRKRWIY